MSCWIALGAGEYTDWGVENFLKPQDECAVLLYDEREFSEDGPSIDQIVGIFEDRGTVMNETKGLIALHQTIV